ncbi:glycogen synthase [bacterium]|nr:MAG: glycogen synthase [bacterium]
MFLIHTSMECYPAAKTGGLGDVVGALPKYLHDKKNPCFVVIPKYRLKWFANQTYQEVHAGDFYQDNRKFHFSIQQVTSFNEGFPLFVIDIPGRFDRNGIYYDNEGGWGYGDDCERFIGFQYALLNWVNVFDTLPDVIHCHDHHTALIPFMMTQSPEFSRLKGVPTVLTIHNGEYHGQYHFANTRHLPAFHWKSMGLLEWNGVFNSLATGIKTAWKVTTVSNSYMDELKYNSAGLEPLILREERKTLGIINGIDDEVWNPETDPRLPFHYAVNHIQPGKQMNKKALCEAFHLDPDKPIISFIGRMVREKGADLLPDLFAHLLETRHDLQFVILGTGERWMHHRFAELANHYRGRCAAKLEYNESLAHLIYAGAEFIIMPSRVEPCGLNQLYAMRYGTIPIVRAVGGLRDTVIDLNEDPQNGYGFRFYNFNLEESMNAIERAINLYYDKQRLFEVQQKIMKLDFSWKQAANQYKNLYKSLVNRG